MFPIKANFLTETEQAISPWIARSYYLLGLAIPFPILFNRIAVFAVLGATLLLATVNWKSWRLALWPRVSCLMLLLLFAVYLLTEILASPKDPAFVFDKFFLFLIFGVVGLTVVTQRHREDIKAFFLQGFLIGNLVTCILNIGRALYRSTSYADGMWKFDSSMWGNTPIAISINNYGNYFFSEFFSWFLHPTYASAYLELCLAYCIWSISQKKMRPLLGVLICSFILINIFLLSAKIAIIAVAVIFLLTSTLIKVSKKLTLVLSIIGVLSLAGSLAHPRIRTAMDISKFETTQRYQSWTASVVVLRDNWLSGVGVSNIRDKLSEIYLADRNQEAVEKKFNAHNQFLETMLASGIFGLIVLLSIFAILYCISYKTKNYLLLVSAVILTIHFPVEAMLSRSEGILFFCCCVVILSLGPYSAYSVDNPENRAQLRRD